MLDEVGLSMQIEPLQNAINKLEKKIEQLGMVHQQGIEMLNFKLQSYERVFETLLQRTQPKSNCVFCSYEDNKDGHPTGRCCRFPDAVARAVQANVLQLCNKCLQQKHDEDCGFRISSNSTSGFTTSTTTHPPSSTTSAWEAAVSQPERCDRILQYLFTLICPARPR
ncbi:unnamed protein product [Heligmosomoides polygyrus]|uniref:Mediator of RNA polymerase II transcription subunit 30 n=1 Tax=Heligmosomoides polygyrus TaxID=6339 RepID=A0A183F7R3_HELPZ|nr:unnamed protein product [Heligmosomoides polygyrus]